MRFGDGRVGITMDLLRRRVGDVWEVWVLCTDESELNELAGVYIVGVVWKLDGVENTVAPR